MIKLVNPCAHEFWRKHPGLIWSNPASDDAAFIRAALVCPRFGRLLEIALEFGLERVCGEWAELQQDDTREVARAREPVERMLANVRKEFDQLKEFFVQQRNLLEIETAAESARRKSIKQEIS